MNYETILLNERYYLKRESNYRYNIVSISRNSVYGTLYLIPKDNKLSAILKMDDDCKDKEELTERIINWLKYFFYEYTVTILKTEDKKYVLPQEENEYFKAIPKVVEQINETEKVLTEQNRSWTEILNSNTFYLYYKEYENLLQGHEVPYRDVFFGASILWPITYGKSALNIKFDKEKITITKGRYEYETSYAYGNPNLFCFSSTELQNLRIKSINHPESELPSNKEIQIDNNYCSIRLFLDKNGELVKAHVCLYINKNSEHKKGKTKGTYHIDYYRHSGFEVYYSNRHGLYTNLMRQLMNEKPELWDMFQTRPTINEFKTIIDIIVEAVQKDEPNINRLDEILNMEELKHIIPEIPVPIIKESLSEVCYTISPKKRKSHERVRI